MLLQQLQKEYYKHWKGYSKAPYPKEFEWDQINEIIDQAMLLSHIDLYKQHDHD